MLFSLEIPVIKLDGERNVTGHARIYYMYTPLQNRGSHGHNGMVVGFTTVQSVPITTKVVSCNTSHGEVYSIQFYESMFVSDLWQVGGFLRVLSFPPPIKLTAMI
jgi:hypothetical protein